MTSAKIYSFAILRSATDAFADKVPYCCALLELEDGSRISALLEGYYDGMAVSIGQTVTSVGKDANGNDIFSL